MMNQLDKLKDIKPIVPIQDHSFLLFLVAILLLILILIAIVSYFLFFKKKKRRRKKLTQKEIALQNLKNLDFTNDKQIAYTFSKDAYLFLNEQNSQKYHEIEKKLSSYKYKKDIPSMPKELKDEIKQFIRNLK